MPVDIRLGGRQKTLGRERPLVLIVEDEPGASELLMNYLANSQFDTAAAANAGEALKLALDLLPDAITLDLLIPGGKGWKVLSEIRRHPETSRTPVIVVSVLEERERAMQMGAAEYLMKPVSRDVLVAAVERNIHATYSHRG
jgi:DNA-binding response OmpR family regulator